MRFHQRCRSIFLAINLMIIITIHSSTCGAKMETLNANLSPRTAPSIGKHINNKLQLKMRYASMTEAEGDRRAIAQKNRMIKIMKNDLDEATLIRVYSNKSSGILKPTDDFSNAKITGRISKTKNKTGFTKIITEIKQILDTPQSEIIKSRVGLRSSPGLWLMIDIPEKKMTYFCVLSVVHRSFMVYAKMSWPRKHEDGRPLWPSRSANVDDYSPISVVRPLTADLQKLVFNSISRDCRVKILSESKTDPGRQSTH